MLLRRLPNRIMRSVPLMGGGQTYAQKVLGYNPIAYWPLWETSGGVAYDISGNDFHGAYTGVTLGQVITDANGVTFTCPLFDGTNDFVDVYSDGLRDAFDTAEGSLMVWPEVFNAGVWTDGITRRVITLENGDQNSTKHQKQAANNRFDQSRLGNNILSRVREDPITVTDWMCLIMTWDESDDEFKAYRGGSQVDITKVGLGAWNPANKLTDGRCVIGAGTVAGPTSLWHGYISNCAVFNSILIAPQVADLAVVG